MKKITFFMHRHVLLGWLLAIPFWWIGAVWVMDRTPPFEVIATVPAQALPGEQLNLVVTVRRDIRRDCSAVFTRYIYDAQYFRYDLEGEQFASAARIKEMEKRTPGELFLSIELPRNISPGPAYLMTDLRYRCNPFHWINPIDITTQIPFLVTKKSP